MLDNNVRSVRLWASYIVDWILLVIFGLIAYGFTYVKPNPHNFSLVDLTISYPLKDDTVPIWVAAFVAGVVPAIIIPVVSFALVPGRKFARGRSRSELLRLKLWEWHTGWLGLAMSLATAVMFTQGLKLFGKPRPNCLARCKPDAGRLAEYTTGRYATDITTSWALVAIDICTETDPHVLYDGFQSWPSGHSSTAWSGLLYLTLYLCSKFAATLPSLPPASYTSSRFSFAQNHLRNASTSSATQSAYKKSDDRPLAPIRYRDEAAAAPIYMALCIIIPLGGATYIACSRYMDYAHHGFDIISGSVLGIVCAYVSFRWYHMPLGMGSGWSWGPRSPDRAFGVGIGECGYVDEERIEQSVRSGGGAAGRATGHGSDEVELGLMGRASTVDGAGIAQDTSYTHAA